MKRRKREPSVDAEPQFRNDEIVPDDLEEKSARTLDREKRGDDPRHERAQHSVFDEPAILPHRPPVLIERDWSCRNCGYNLRGLMTGHPCPECGVVELYEPPRPGELTYADWLAGQRHLPPARSCWLVAIAAALAALPFAMASGFLTVEYFKHVVFILLGPVLAETLKIAIPATLIERRSRYVRRVEQVYVMTLGTALMFAVTQNVIYALVYFANASPELVLYRWTVGLLLHLTCTMFATRGLVAVWSRVDRQRPSAAMSGAYPHIATAIAVHAVFNACIFFTGAIGYGF